MKLAVVCANGKEGKLIVKEALTRGLDVTAVVRGENRSMAEKAIVKDVFALTAQDLCGFDVVIDAFGAWTPETISGIPMAVKHLCSLLSGSKTRLVIVGGAGSLYVDASHTRCVADGPDFPESFKPLAAAHDEALSFLRTQKDVRWTYVSPAADFQADGARTGSYTLAGEELTLNTNGQSTVSYADFAIAMVDEAVSGAHVGARISVVSKS